jgi:ABC-type bacteriocin/lantibiotic exporter with double-glycine peptidase domain
MFKSLVYYHLFQKFYTGKLFTFLFVVFAVGISDAFSIIMFIPLFELFSNQEEISADGISAKILNIFNFFSIPYDLIPISIVVISILSLKGLLILISFRWISYARAKIIENIRLVLLRNLFFKEKGQSTQQGVGEAINLINDQATRALNAFTHFSSAVMNIVLSTMYISFGLLLNAKLTLSLIIFICIFLYLFKRLNRRVKTISIDVGEQTSILSQYVIETVQALKYIKVSKTSKFFQNRSSNSIVYLAQKQQMQGNAKAIIHAVKEPFLAVLITATFLIQFYTNDRDFAQTIVTLVVFYRALSSASAFQSTWQSMLENVGGMELIDKYLERRVTQAINENKSSVFLTHLASLGGSLEIDTGTIKCPSFEASIGDAIMITGSTGSGKSTFMNHMIGLAVTPDLLFTWDYNIKPTPLADVASINFGYIGPDCELFDGSVLENVTMKKCLDEVDMSQLNRALRIAQCSNFLSNSESLTRRIEYRGSNFSSGQCQRILLARELYRINHGFLFLDEATSAIDRATERALFTSLLESNSYAIININHRKDNIDLFDREIKFN